MFLISHKRTETQKRGRSKFLGKEVKIVCFPYNTWAQSQPALCLRILIAMEPAPKWNSGFCICSWSYCTRIIADSSLNLSPWAQPAACMMTPCWLFVRNLQCTHFAIIVGGHGSLFGSYEKSSDSGNSDILCGLLKGWVEAIVVGKWKRRRQLWLTNSFLLTLCSEMLFYPYIFVSTSLVLLCYRDKQAKRFLINHILCKKKRGQCATRELAFTDSKQLEWFCLGAVK